LRQEQDPPPEQHLIRQFLDATGAQRSEHRAKDDPLPRPEQADFLGGRDPPPTHTAKHSQRRPHQQVPESAGEGELRNGRLHVRAHRRGRLTSKGASHVSLKWPTAVIMTSFACTGAPAPAATPASLGAPTAAVSTAAMDAHLKYLADDLLEGRAPATRGGRLAAKYIAAQFEALGLEPAGGDGSYFQPVALVGMTPHPSLMWGKGGATRSLTYLGDFVAWAERPESHIVAEGEVVFVGYGVDAEEWQWDDYKDVDVRGKVVLMLVNDPGLQDSTSS